MRRMYSEQELTKVIEVVFEKELEDGAFDEAISDAVDAYLVEHPVDITALEGQDISPKDVSATGNITGKTISSNEAEYSKTFSVFGLPEGLTITNESYRAFKVINNVLYIVAQLKVQNDTENQITGGFVLYTTGIEEKYSKKIIKVDGTDISVSSSGSNQEVCDVPAIYKKNVGDPVVSFSRVYSPAVNRIDITIPNSFAVDANSYSIVSIRVPIILL